MRIAIIPAAGKAKRFNGLIKEALPNREGVPLLVALASSLYWYVDKIVVVTSPEKIATHAFLLQENNKVLFKLQDEYNKDLLEAVYSGLKATEHDEVIFCMPDTVFPLLETLNIFSSINSTLKVGLFKTDHPENFGVIDETRTKVLDKDPSLAGTTQDAWGVLSWKKEVSDTIIKLYERTEFKFQEVLTWLFSVEHQPTVLVPMKYYYDLKNISSYKEYLNEDTITD